MSSITKTEESSCVVATTLNLSQPEDKGFWEDYLKKVTDEDMRLISRWQKVLDTLLVYVGLFIGVLTAFIIQISSLFQPSPEDAANKIFIAIYNRTMNDSSPIDLQQYLSWDKKFDKTVTSSVFLLYISLAVSVSEAAFALFISVWLARHQRSLTETGPTIHERIRKRHETYKGLMEWRMPILIEILPTVGLVALLFFAAFISQSVWDAYPIAGKLLDNIFVMTALFFVLTASFAAFIPGTPFHSPLSGIIRFIFLIFPNWSIGGIIRIRTICVTFVFVVSFIALFKFDQKLPWALNIILMFLIPVSLLSLCQRTQAEVKELSPSKPRLFSLAIWLYSHSLVIIVLFFAMMSVESRIPRMVLFSLAGVTLVVVIIGALKMTHGTSDEVKAKAEAVAWLIRTQPSHNLTMFKKAIEIARTSPDLRSSLLEDTLPVLDVVINSIRGDTEQDLDDGEKVYITLLAVLVDFKPCRASFWRNEAAMERPILSNELKEKLRTLQKGGCDVDHSLPPPSGCVKADAEFILGKVGEEDSTLEKESAKMLSHWHVV